MTFGFSTLIVLYILYLLLIRGFLWRIILGGFGWLGMYWYLNTIPDCHGHPFNNDTFTWAMVIPTIILLLAMLYSKEE